MAILILMCISFLLHLISLQVIELYHPLALRLFLIGTHYRSPINYSILQLESASERIFYIYQVPQHVIFPSYVNHPNVLKCEDFCILWLPVVCCPD